MPYRYSKKNTEEEEKNIAKAAALSAPISTKQSVEICSMIRGKELQKAKEMLKKVMNEEMAVPFKRYKKNIGHRPKIGPGRYPKNASEEILNLLEQVEANAQFKGIGTANLIISHISAQKASRSWHFGRKRRIRMKRTHIEVMVKEQKKEIKETKEKTAKKEDKK